MAEHTKGPWEDIICATADLRPITTKTEYLEVCEKCWDLTQKHGDAQEKFYGVQGIAEEGNRVTIALCGNGPHGKANARLIAAAPETKEQRDALLDACKNAADWLENCAIWLETAGQYDINVREARDKCEAAIAKAEE